jgi:peptidoglycan hydrolase-like protein with peptidoglycan-binding domain
MHRIGLARPWRAAILLATAMALMVPATASAGYAERTLQKGSRGGDVKLLQRYLTRAGFQARADGHFGERTRRAVRAWERAAQRRSDGRASRGEQRLVRRSARSGARTSEPKPQAEQTGAQPQGNPSEKAVIGPDGRTAIAPDGAPQPVKDAIAAANRITDKPYRYGGGHGRWEDSGYDCSGAVSYALHGGDLLDAPLDSSGLARWGSAGRGEWITVYANSGHAYVVIAGLRFDTSSAGAGGEKGPRWRKTSRSPEGYTARHPDGL